MHTIRCIAAEWLIIRARLWRTRLGMWLLLLAASFTWVAPPYALTPVTVRVGLFAGLLCVSFAVGARVDRLALRTTLGHPTSPLAITVGRWLGATIAASLAVTGVSVALALRDGTGSSVLVSGWITGVAAAGGAAGAALPAVVWGGNVPAAALIAAAALLDPEFAAAPSFIYLLMATAVAGILGSAAVVARWR